MSEDFEDELVATLGNQFDVEPELIGAAAARGAELFEDWSDDLDVTADDVADVVAGGPYDAFERNWNVAVGDLCSGVDRCTDSRDYRFAGFDDVKAVQ